MKVGDKVLITGCPITESRLSNEDYKMAQNTIGEITHIYFNGERNYLVSWGKYNAINYYSANDLALLNKSDNGSEK